MSTPSPRDLVDRMETSPALPAGTDERFDGYVVMGLPFRSGHVLALRRWAASSIGPAYASAWHRRPDGTWRFYADVSPRLACTRYLGSAATEASETQVRISWSDPFRFEVHVPGILEWSVVVRATAATRLLNAVAGRMPGPAWHNGAFLDAMGMLAGPMLRAGRIGMRGTLPNRQRFVANPRRVWMIDESRAVVGGEDLGPLGPVHPQARLGDFWIPQRGLFAIGQALFDPFDPTRHAACTTIAGD
jgi:hypothetical protein